MLFYYQSFYAFYPKFRYLQPKLKIRLNISRIKSYNSFEPQFIGAPYDFWVGADAPIGTSVGQIRVAGTDDRDIVFDMFHSYNEVGKQVFFSFFFNTSVLKDFQYILQN